MDWGNLHFDDNVAMLAGLIAFGVPPIVAVINRRAWSSDAKAICAFVISLLAAAATAYVAGDIDSKSDLVTAALVVVTGAQAFYHWFWHPSTIAPAIEAKTG